jgi:phenylalanyl-tRNA synthetase beta chain
VLVEAAWFDPMIVRRTARRHGLHTDASHRFERGADFNAGPVASALVSSILLANGGALEGDLVDVRIPAAESRTANRKPVALALSEVQRILGRTIDPEGLTAAIVENVLTALGCGLSPQPAGNNEAWHVTLPSWRLDLDREIDLIEEVARVYGYNRFANTLPAFGEGVRALPWGGSESAARCSQPGFTKPSAAPSAPPLTQPSPRRNRVSLCRSAILSVKRLASCAHRSSPACSA